MNVLNDALGLHLDTNKQSVAANLAPQGEKIDEEEFESMLAAIKVQQNMCVDKL